jgi:hypothetical protein
MTYYYVADGVIAVPPSQWVWVGEQAATASAFPRPHTVGAVSLGADATDADLAALGVYKLAITERGDAPGPEYQPTTGALVVDAVNGLVTRTDGWREPTAEERAAYLQGVWADQAQARKERDARKVLALPDSDDPAILKQKLNAALALLNVR